MTGNNVSEAEIAYTLQKMKDSDLSKAPLFILSALIKSVIVVPTIIDFLSLLFVSNKSQN